VLMLCFQDVGFLLPLCAFRRLTIGRYPMDAPLHG
jgi:hypothetical protein